MKALLFATAFLGMIAVQSVVQADVRGGAVAIDQGTPNETTCAYQLEYDPQTRILSSVIWCDDGYQRNWSGPVALPPGVFF